MNSLQQNCPLPLHPFPPKNGGTGVTPPRRNGTAVGLHFHFAGRLTQSYILKLLDTGLGAAVTLRYTQDAREEHKR
jgi:hypothetical protein